MIYRLNKEAFLQLLKENGWTQEQFAQRAGVTLSTVQSVLSGRRRPGAKFILGLINVGVPLEEVGKYVEPDALPVPGGRDRLSY